MIYPDKRLIRYSFVLPFFLSAPVLCEAQAPPAYTISTVAGNCSPAPCTGNYAGDGGPATNAFLSSPSGVAVEASGNIDISDTVNQRIRHVDLSTGLITTIIGNGNAGYMGDGAQANNTATELSSPNGIFFDSHGNLFIADTGNFVVREINSSGVISTVAGNNSLGRGFSGDGGAATSALLWNPSSVAVDTAGNMYIADPGNNVVRVVCANQTPVACKGLAAGHINTVAGNYATGANYSGDHGPATQALLNDPVGVALDASGNLYISDSGNNAIRKVDTKGIITTIAGMGPFASGYSGDGGPATEAELDAPKGIAMDASGYLYIADTVNCVIRVVEPNGTITTIAGNSSPGYRGDGGPAKNAELYFPAAVAVSGGKIYIADYDNNVIRLLTPPAQTPQINTGGVVNGASYTAAVAPGGIADVFGTFHLASSSTDTVLPLPIAMQNLSFDFGGAQTPLYFASNGQVNLQIPWELTGQTSAALKATLYATTGPSETIQLAAYAPAIFSMNAQGTGPGAILDASYHLIDSANPAIPGTTYILIYCTGLGAVGANQPATGAAASLTDLAPTTIFPTVTIGGVKANVKFSGLAPGYVGLYQVNALVPASVASGSEVPVVISMPGADSNTVTIVVQ